MRDTAAPATVAGAGGDWAVGVDLGGTKTEVRLFDAAGAERWRRRIATPRADGFDAIVAAAAALAAEATQQAIDAGAPRPPTVGVGAPGTVTRDGRIKNSNTVCLNGRRLPDAFAAALGRPVAVANDANCLALSEATDGAGTGAGVVFAAILGTGCGAGIAIAGRPLDGVNGLAGEWGHVPLPWADDAVDGPPPRCWCGHAGCIETWLSGPAIAADHARRHGGALDTATIAARARAGDADAAATIDRWHGRLARALAMIVNVVDPDVVVLGGGLSAIASTYAVVPQRWGRWVFAGGAPGEPVRTRLVAAAHGDASGVRGAAWLGRAADSLPLAG